MIFRKIFAMFIFFGFFISIIFTEFVMGGKNDKWLSCCAPGQRCDYKWGETEDVSGTTYYCCAAENGWTTSLSCNENDESDPFFQYGCTEDCSGFMCDYCEDSDKLIEYVCYENEKTTTPISCSYVCQQLGYSGGNCTDGKCVCSTQCSDSDNGKAYFVAGTCTDASGSYEDTCGSGNKLTEYYCSEESCTPTTIDCDSYDYYYCSASGNTLYRKFRNYYCANTNPDKCAYTTSTIDSWTCDSSKECSSQSCEGTNYLCYYSNAGSYEWSPTYPSTETACNDNHDNDCDGLTDCDDSDCSDDTIRIV